MKEFDHPHVTKLIGKPAVLLTPAPSPPASHAHHHCSLKAALVQAPLCCREQHLHFPGLRGVWSGCKC